MRISVHVVPGSKRRLIEPGDPWKIHVCSRPVEGKANQEVIEALSDHFKVRRSAIHIMSGQSSHNKIIEIETANEQKK